MVWWIRQIGFFFSALLARFEPRERVFVLLGLVAVVVLLGYHFFLAPFLDRLEILDRLIAQKQDEVVEMADLSRQYQAVQQKVASIEVRIARSREGFSLFSHVEGTAVRNRVKENIVSIRPQPEQVSGPYREVGVEVKVENLSLPQLVKFLRDIQQTQQIIRIKRMQLKKQYSDPRLLSGTFVIASYERST